MPGIIPELTWRTRPDGTLCLVIPAEHAGLMGERPAGRMGQLSKVLGRPMELVVEDR